ncbi:MAG: hypothetical protein AB7T38_09840 [Nitrospirales bacterium]
MKVMWAPRGMSGVGQGIPQTWPAGFPRHCDNCGLEWEAFQEYENCPLAELEVELFPCFWDDTLQNLDPGTRPVTIKLRFPK